jgi:transcriptional regulator with XRE-family HTH domain
MDDAKHRKTRDRVIYDTRFDRFLYRENVNLDDLAEALGTTRQNLGKWREGRKPRQDTIARVVLALRKVLQRPVNASEVFYLGEAHDDDTPEAKEMLATTTRICERPESYNH